MRRGAGAAFLGVGAVVVVATVGYFVLRDSDRFFPASDECTVEVDGHRVDLTVEQAENAALITAISVRRGMPARAASIALATAYQESKLTNIEYGDRDSIGLFQQRPSQGWGTREQIMDPVYATNAFYDALDRVDGYESLEITVAAQEVQRSAFPSAYADHEADARALASALTGHSPSTFGCDVDRATSSGRTDLVRRELAKLFDAPARVDGRTATVRTADDQQAWAIAHYLVAMADRLEVHSVRVRDRVWVAGDGDRWRQDPDGRGPRGRVLVAVGS